MASCPVDFLTDEDDCVSLEKIYEFFKNNNPEHGFIFSRKEGFERLSLGIRPDITLNVQIDFNAKTRKLCVYVEKEQANRRPGEFWAYGYVELCKVERVRFLKRQKQGEGDEGLIEYFVELFDASGTLVRIYKNAFLVFPQ